MSFLSYWNEVYSAIETFAETKNIDSVSKGKPGFVPSESPFIYAFASPLPVRFGEGARAQKKSMEVLVFVGEAGEDVTAGIERAVDTAEQLGDYLAAKFHNITSMSVEFDSIYGDNIVASLTLNIFYR